MGSNLHQCAGCVAGVLCVLPGLRVKKITAPLCSLKDLLNFAKIPTHGLLVQGSGCLLPFSFLIIQMLSFTKLPGGMRLLVPAPFGDVK